MSNPYVGEIRMFAGTFAPEGWWFCDGSLLPIDQFDLLFNLIGTTYGGDGQQDFGVPDLRGRTPLGVTAGGLGSMGGAESVTLTRSTTPLHTHTLQGTVNPGTSSPVQDAVPASLPAAGTASAYGLVAPTGAIDVSTITPTGSNQPHENRQPYQCVSYIISLYGIYPSPAEAWEEEQ